MSQQREPRKNHPRAQAWFQTWSGLTGHYPAFVIPSGFAVVLLLAFVTLSPVGASAQEAPNLLPPITSAPTSDDRSFAELMIVWSDLQSEMAGKQKEFDRSEDIVQRDALRRQYSELVLRSNQLIQSLKDAGLKKLEAEGPSPLLLKTLLGIMVNDANNRQDSEVLAMADALIGRDIDPAYWEAAAKLDRLSIEGKEIFEEIIIRHREHQADDLPIVKITTNRGELMVELFENEAPNTVANFISLVKSDFYNGLTFHRVLEGFMAQAGCPEGTGMGGPGYTIPDEHNSPEARRHFTGVLSMANTGQPESGGSQFFITFTRSDAVQNLDGKHTVFGRVISGEDVLGKLTRTHQSLGFSENPIPNAVPDTIEKMEVVRDRGHEYVPEKAGESQPAAPPVDPPPARPDGGVMPPATDSLDPPIQSEDEKQKDGQTEKKEGSQNDGGTGDGE